MSEEVLPLVYLVLGVVLFRGLRKFEAWMVMPFEDASF